METVRVIHKNSRRQRTLGLLRVLGLSRVLGWAGCSKQKPVDAPPLESRELSPLASLVVVGWIMWGRCGFGSKVSLQVTCLAAC